MQIVRRREGRKGICLADNKLYEKNDISMRRKGERECRKLAGDKWDIWKRAREHREERKNTLKTRGEK
jgi:hypothetical protein